MSKLDIRNLHASIDDREILKGVNLTVKKGEVHALMGPNGTGKSTLAYVLMGHPNYQVTEGEVWFKGQNILELEPDVRAHPGIFLAFQYPVSIPGVSMANFLRSAINDQRKAQNPEDKGIPVPEFRKLLKEKMAMLKMDQTFAGRYLNDGFSGGEKKRAEILQMATLQPQIAILDETDEHDPVDHLGGFWKRVRRGTGKRFREVDLGDINPFGGGSGADVHVAGLGLEPGDELKYVYDFGDWIEHRITLEDIVEPETKAEYPRIIGQNKPKYRYCQSCQAKGQKTVATWICIDCSNDQQRDVLICEDCLSKEHEDHFADEVLY